MTAPLADTVCPVCGRKGTSTTVTCKECGAYLQERIPVLHLFATAGLVLTSPAEAFHRITRSERKNYVTFLASLTGPALLAATMVLAGLGNTPVTLASVLLALVALGPVYGILLVALQALMMFAMSRILTRARVPLRTLWAVTGYAQIPLVFVSVCCVPLLIGLFGVLLFSTNPAPWEVNLTAAWIFAMVVALCLGWTFVNLIQATQPIGFSIWSRILMASTALLSLGAVIIGLSYLLQIFLHSYFLGAL